jgi:hypothetical protein
MLDSLCLLTSVITGLIERVTVESQYPQVCSSKMIPLGKKHTCSGSTEFSAVLQMLDSFSHNATQLPLKMSSLHTSKIFTLALKLSNYFKYFN